MSEGKYNERFCEMLKRLEPWTLSAMEARYEKETGKRACGSHEFDFTADFLAWQGDYYCAMLRDCHSSDRAAEAIFVDLRKVYGPRSA